jgi:hypothetical protein
VGLVISRDALRTRLRRTTPVGIPLLTEATTLFASYLTAERDLGRIAPDADVDTLARTLIGAGHLLAAGQTDTPPATEAFHRVSTTVLAGVTRQPPSR